MGSTKSLGAGVVLTIVAVVVPASNAGMIIDSFEDVVEGAWPVPRPSPVDADLAGTDACGLEMGRQLLVDWSRITAGSEVPSVAVEILRADDDDGDLWNGTPHCSRVWLRALGTARGESRGCGLSGGTRRA